MKSSVVILAGGFGTRMSRKYPHIPKPMVPINGVPILEHLIKECVKYKKFDILLVLHHMPEIIMNYFKDGSKYGARIKYFIEKTPLGTGGALLSVRNIISDQFLVLYADVFSSVNLEIFQETHNKKGADISILVHPNDHPMDSDLVIINKDNYVTSFSSHPHDSSKNLANIVNAALYCMNISAIDFLDKSNHKFDIAQDLFPKAIDKNKKIYAYKTVEYIKDMGTPTRRDKVEDDLLKGIVSSRQLNKKRKAIFLDRDGTINIEEGYLKNPNEMKIIPGSGEAIQKINRSKYLAICVTNQPVIARGECDLSTLDNIHNKMDNLLGEYNAYLDRLYYCPHHPDSGFKGEIKSLKIKCDCRKPRPGMVNDAKKELNINLKDSWVVGDRTSDITLAKNTGMLSAMVRTGAAGNDLKFPNRPTFIGSDLNEVTEYILNDFENLCVQITNIIELINDKKYIFIAGQARSGKTSVAMLFKELLSRDNINAHIIELDRFLIDKRSEEQKY